jgi:predicted acylesterase/phospholipase RssA/CRP-like cAMP-binding protein
MKSLELGSAAVEVMAAFGARAFGLHDLFSRYELKDDLERVHLDRGETLFEQGDPGDSMYVLLRGHLGVRLRKPDGSQMVIGEETEPGESIGEMALLTGQPRLVTVYAISDADLVRLPKGSFNQLAHECPQEVADFAETVMMPRWQRVQLALVLTDLFGELDTEALLDLQGQLEWQQLERRQILFQRGDPADAMYVVVNGRLRVVATRQDGSERVVGEVGPGEMVGEFALLSGEPHSASVYAIRETDVFMLTQADFAHLLDLYPQAMLQITRAIIRRQRQALRLVGREESRSLTLALVPADPELPLAEFAHDLARSLEPFGRVLQLDSSHIDELYGKAGTAGITLDEPMSLVLAGWMSDQETRYRYILYAADPGWTTWTERCVCQADRILIVGHPGADPRPGPVETAIDSTGATARRELVLLHPVETVRPAGTAPWLSQRQVLAHHHVRQNDDIHYQSLARRLTGQAVGLVLSGGAARGFAHLGVFRALEELGIAIDRVGGTSMGALMGAGYAMGRTYAEMLGLAERLANPKQLFDYTLPYVSLMASKKVTNVTIEVFEGLCIEDLWRPFFCVSSNLTQAQPVVHQMGPLWKAVRASIAIPGVFSPILHEGDVLVDGGAMNNFPVDIMRDLCGAGTVIGVNVSPAEEIAKEYEFGPSISGWQVLWGRINPLARQMQVPNVAANLVRALEVDSLYLLKSTQSLADLLIQPDVKGFASLDFAAYEAISEIGYMVALHELALWQEQRRSVLS